jgi:hypothetical protein
LLAAPGQVSAQFSLAQNWSDNIAFDLHAPAQAKPRFFPAGRRRGELCDHFATFRNENWFVSLSYLFHELQALCLELGGTYGHGTGYHDWSEPAITREGKSTATRNVTIVPQAIHQGNSMMGNQGGGV